MKLKFEPSDFTVDGKEPEGTFTSAHDTANIANKKLEKYIKEHGTIVFSTYENDNGKHSSWFPEKTTILDTHNFKRAGILINIEPFQKCDHSKVKIIGYETNNLNVVFKCECGARLFPKTFEVCE